MLPFATLCRWGILGAVLLTAGSAQAQGPEPPTETHCLLLPLAPAQRAQAAALVVEAEVLSQRSFWDAEHRHIYTANELRMFKLLKGQWQPGAPLTVVTEGGTVGDEAEMLTNTLRLAPGQQGLLFLVPARFRGLRPADGAWTAYASQQGFIAYDLATASAAEPFRRYPLLDAGFYQQQAGQLGQPWRELAPNPALRTALSRQQQPTQARGNAPIISGFEPRALVAGADSVLTITGSGFGTATGRVSFRNADDGGNTFTSVTSRDILNWADTRIQVRVPSYSATGNPSGTGTFRVSTADQLTADSPLPLTVRYVLTNVQETTSGVAYRPGHLNQNGRGGYTFRPDPGLGQNTAALAAFGRALSSWRCQTAINWETGPARTVRGVASDDVNALEFDQGAELPVNVLGRTTSYYAGCRDGSGGVRFWVKEIDMQFDDAVSWQFGPAVPNNTQFDFETVVLHELGHAQQLGHLIAPQLVMHYAVARGQVTRQLNFARDVRGGYAAQLLSLASVSCGPTPELPAPLISQLTAEVQNGQVQLSWTAGNECSGTAFQLERNISGQWRLLSQQANTSGGAGTTTYRLTDVQPLGADVTYYRVRVLLANGLALPAAPVGVRATDSGPTLAIFPNPATGTSVMLEYNAPAASEQLEVRIFDAIGRYYGGRRLTVPQSGINTLPLALPTLRPGWYVLRWDDGGRHGTVPFVRTR